MPAANSRGQRLRSRIQRGDPYWPPQLAVAVAVGLNFTLTERVTVGPTWLLPSVEAVLLVVLVAVAPGRAVQHNRLRRRSSLIVIGIVSVTNLVSLALLVHYLVNGGRAQGHALILSGVVLWSTNVLLFSVWFWELDRGGPVARFVSGEVLPDFQFPQMENPALAPAGWRPGYLDYLYLSLTNATAFSPTDVMPLTHTAKVVMATQSVAALVTVGLVLARAVNILA